ncbi:MAG TPA: RNA polymerase-associated protein RapA [Spirochaetota bacterium]|nr:RNA polymerase-associated protein RapA [Spirochaetota bacterium]
MGAFTVGQRWISEMELELGLGTVRAVRARTVEMHFAASDCTRVYAVATAPLRRAAFMAGDTVRPRGGAPFEVKAVSEEAGLRVYHGDAIDCAESDLDDAISFTTPRIRLFGKLFDHDRDFRIRYRALSLQRRIVQSPVRGFLGGRISLIPHQLYVTHAVAERAVPRVLLSDEIGLGKTIEACLVLQRLLLCRRIDRVLILVPQSLVHQWFAELLRRFNLVFKIYNRDYQKSVRASDRRRNPFHEDQRFIAAVEFVAADATARAMCAEAGWDVVVVDEAHHLVEGGPEYSLVDSLGAASPGLVLLTATPEQFGRRSHFARMRLLDPARYHDYERFDREEERYYAISRIANMVMHGEVPDDEALSVLGPGAARISAELRAGVAAADEAARQRFIGDLVDRYGTGRAIFRNTREGMTGFPERRVRLVPLAGAEAVQKNMTDEFAADIADGAIAIDHDFSGDPRCAWLGDFLKEHPDRKALLLCRTREKAVAIEKFLQRRGHADIALFHEDLPLLVRDQNAAWFAMARGARLLISSEIGSEGRNFQFAHDLILFDLPTDPELLEQRIGRLDRIGQGATIDIHVPFVIGSEYEVLARWYHEGADAFATIVPGAYELYQRFGEAIVSVAQRRDHGALAALVPETRAFCAEIAERLRNGRDRLLELNSFDPAAAERLLGEIRDIERDGELEAFMLDIFEHFNIVAEPLSDRTHRLRLDLMTTDEFPLPVIGRDDLRVTFSRESALRNEDLEFLTWDHPMVTGVLDIVLGRERGNCALGAWHDPSTPELLLEAVFVVECVAPRRLHVDRFLPPRPIRVVVNNANRDRTDAITVDLCERNVEHYADMEVLDDDDVKNVLLPRMIARCVQIAEEGVAGIVAAGLSALDSTLATDLERMRALGTINTNITEDEIAVCGREIDALREAIRSARVRLDSLRLILKGDLESD